MIVTALLSILYLILIVMSSMSAIKDKRNNNKKWMAFNILAVVCFSLAGAINLFK